MYGPAAGCTQWRDSFSKSHREPLIQSVSVLHKSSGLFFWNDYLLHRNVILSPAEQVLYSQSTTGAIDGDPRLHYKQ
jgi:hypothetical protein